MRASRWSISGGFRKACVHAVAGAGLLYISALGYDLSRDRVQYVVATAHLDTQWFWTVETTIRELLPATLRDNFALFTKYPGYVFSFEGAYRYMLAKRYYPSDYTTLRRWVEAGNWAVAGGMIDACDVNIPSPESLIRQILYGNGFFEEEFGRRSLDLFLPDCFGFGAALPTIAAHCGMKGFSTAKLDWPTVRPKPFDIGFWRGVDGNGVVAVLSPGPYGSNWEIRTTQIEALGLATGIYAAYDYFGVGDQGGANPEDRVAALMARVAQNPQSHVKVVSAPSDQFFRDLSDDQIARLPSYQGELLLRTHGTGGYTAWSRSKLLNRQCELAAAAAEAAAVIAGWAGQATYPALQLKNAWIRFLWHQFHDDITGTSIKAVYAISHRDCDSSLAEFRSIRDRSLWALATLLDTRSEGTPVIVFNPLAIEREDVVEVPMALPDDNRTFVAVCGPNGEEVPAQITGGDDAKRVVFVARVPPMGCAVYDIRASATPGRTTNGLLVTPQTIENSRYVVQFNSQGDISQIWDKKERCPILAGPVQLQLFNDKLHNTGWGQWPAWEIHWEDLVAGPRAVVSGPARVTVVEKGPARGTIMIARTCGSSTFEQTVSLAADGQRVEVRCTVDWQERQTLLKAAFPLAVASAEATYDLGLGTIQRPNSTSAQYEVPAQQWADITAADNRYGVAVINDCKYGWDKPADNTLRLTLIHTPEATAGFSHQSDIDVGLNRFAFALYGHAGDWRVGKVVGEAGRFNQPLVAFVVDKHHGPWGRSFSFVRSDTERIDIMALKKAEKGAGWIVRVRETWGKPVVGATLTFCAPILRARLVNGYEDDLGVAAFSGSSLRFNCGGYQPMTFRVELDQMLTPIAQAESSPAPLSRVRAIELRIAAQGRVVTAAMFPDVLGAVQRATVKDLKGRTIRVLSGADCGWDNVLVWDGRDGAGRMVPAGRYVVSLLMENDRQRAAVVEWGIR